MSAKIIFPTKVYSSGELFEDPEDKNLQMISEIFKLSEIDEEGLTWCEQNYFGGYTSYATYNQLQQFSTSFGELAELILPHVDKFVSELEYDIEPGSLQMTDCWANIMPQGTHHSGHIHPNSVISGTYYLQVPEGSPSIKFEDPRLPMQMNTPKKKQDADDANKCFVSWPAQDGDLVLFESYLRHEVPANLSDEDRISISFNFELL